jgi:hypothetical protein
MIAITAPAAQGTIAAASRWLAFAERHWHFVRDGRGGSAASDRGYFGTGSPRAQGPETTAEHAFVCAFLAQHTEYDPAAGGFSREHLTGRAVAALRHLVATHFSASLESSTRPAGSHPVAPLGWWGGDGMTPKPATYLSLVADTLDGALPADVRDGLRRALAYEADANLAEERCTERGHHGHYYEVPPIPTERFGASHPESNAWRAGALAAALLHWPDHERTGRWRESMHRHLVNAFSVPQDAGSDVVVDGRPVRERFVGANVHPHFALEHHGFFHPCYAFKAMEYMILTAHAFERRGQRAPDGTGHHLLDVWQVLRRLILWRGRLAYPAGADKHRYGWGATYMLPCLAWIATRSGDPAAAWLERSASALLLDEQRQHGDGSFVSGRMGALLGDPPDSLQARPSSAHFTYYRAEVDPPFYLMLAQMLRDAAARERRTDVGAGLGAAALPPEIEASICGTFEEPDAALVFRRDPGRFVSWSWRAHQEPTAGLFVPRGGDHLAEWNANLAPVFVLRDAPLAKAGRNAHWHRTVTFDGGFATLGAAEQPIGPGPYDARALVQHALYVALPDGRSAVYADEVRPGADVTILHQEGFRLNLANDLFNGYRRRLRYQGGEAWLVAGQPADERLVANGSEWLVVDDLLGVQFVDGAREPWTVRTFPRRNATNSSLWYDVLCRPLRSGPRPFEAGEVVQRTCARLAANVSGDDWVSSAACAWGGERPSIEVCVDGLDGRRYQIVADWTLRTVMVRPI